MARDACRARAVNVCKICAFVVCVCACVCACVRVCGFVRGVCVSETLNKSLLARWRRNVDFRRLPSIFTVGTHSPQRERGAQWLGYDLYHRPPWWCGDDDGACVRDRQRCQFAPPIRVWTIYARAWMMSIRRIQRRIDPIAFERLSTIIYMYIERCSENTGQKRRRFCVRHRLWWDFSRCGFTRALRRKWFLPLRIADAIDKRRAHTKSRNYISISIWTCN